ncbi:MAG TPA: Rhs element Vgr protein, partial [Cytophagales bacterium]|nr:Rhs element Vgr protein [Cytophagales bacterium]
MPESTPISFLVLVDGTEVPGALQVYAATVLKEANKIPTAKVTVRDGDPAAQDFEQSSGDLFTIGKEIEIQVGPAPGEEEPIFKGVITEIGLKVRSGIGPVFMVLAKDPAFALTLGEKNRYFYEATDADAIDEIVGEAGLSADAEAGSVTHQTLVQYQATDWDFIVMRAEANGQLVFVEDSTLRIAAPDFGGSSLETYKYGDTLLEVECTLDGRGQYPAVAGKTWSASDQALVEVDGEAPTANKQGDKDSDTLGGDLSVPDVTVQHNGQVLETELQAYADAALVKSRLAR